MKMFSVTFIYILRHQIVLENVPKYYNWYKSFSSYIVFKECEFVKKINKKSLWHSIKVLEINNSSINYDWWQYQCWTFQKLYVGPHP